MVKKRQVNIRISEDEYRILEAAADELEQPASTFVREVALAAAEPEPVATGPGALPAWLMALIVFLAKGRVGAEKPGIAEKAAA